ISLLTFIDIFLSLPKRVFENIILYLYPCEIRESFMCLNKSCYWKLKYDSTSLWQKIIVLHGVYYSCILANPPLSSRRSKGKVTVGYQIHSGNPIAVRTVHLATVNAEKDDGIPTSFLREAALLQKLDNQNILRYYGTELDSKSAKQSRLHIITEFIPQNLENLIQRISGNSNDKFLKERKDKIACIQSVLTQIVNGVAYLHERGIIHRNLKPENIFVLESIPGDDINNADGCKTTIKIGDFGMSRLLNSHLEEYTPEENPAKPLSFNICSNIDSIEGLICRCFNADPRDRERSWRESKRIYYRAPEIIMRTPEYGLEVDMWSIGVIFLELVLGYLPFSAQNELSYLCSIFRLIGTPQISEWSSLAGFPKEFVCCLPTWSPLPIKLINKLYMLDKNKKESELRAVFKHLETTNQLEIAQSLLEFRRMAGEDGLNLLFKLLLLPGTDRITASQCAQHKFLKDSSRLFHQAKQRKSLTSIEKRSLSFAEQNGLLLQIYNIETLALSHSFDWSVNTFSSLQTEKTTEVYQTEVNRLFTLQERFELMPQTLHLAMSFFNRYLRAMFNDGELPHADLRLIARVCLKIANVLNERSREYYKSNNVYNYTLSAISSSEETAEVQLDEKFQSENTKFLQSEKAILTTLHFDLLDPTIIWFLEAYFQLARISRDSQCVVFAYFLADLALYQQELIPYSAMQKAQMIMLIAVSTYHLDSSFFLYSQDIAALLHDKQFGKVDNSRSSALSSYESNERVEHTYGVSVATKEDESHFGYPNIATSSTFSNAGSALSMDEVTPLSHYTFHFLVEGKQISQDYYRTGTHTSVKKICPRKRQAKWDASDNCIEQVPDSLTKSQKIVTKWPFFESFNDHLCNRWMPNPSASRSNGTFPRSVLHYFSGQHSCITTRGIIHHYKCLEAELSGFFEKKDILCRIPTESAGIKSADL
ncbi:hypothetical protein IE077_003997, partial [Cardiosporidium cionae]